MEAQVDWYEAYAELDGELHKMQMFCMRSMASGGAFHQPGDLVFFNTLGRLFSHVGFYLGEGQFVHAPARSGRVRVEQMSQPNWRSRFNGARRLEVPQDGRAAAAPAESAGPLPVAADASRGSVDP